MKVKHNRFDELRIEVVQEALERGNVALTARKHGLSPYSLYKWVKQYRDEVESPMSQKKEIEQQKAGPAEENWQKKYERATQLLGEKELEIAVLRDLVKKKNPNIQFKWPDNGS